MQAVEAGGQIENAAVNAAGDRGAVRHQRVVLVSLAEDEEQAHQERHGVPPAQAEDVTALGGEDTHLAGERRGDQHQCHRNRLEEIQFGRRRRPDTLSVRACGEIHREQSGEEHQLTGQPHDRADTDHVRSVQRMHAGRYRSSGGAYSARHRMKYDAL